MKKAFTAILLCLACLGSPAWAVITFDGTTTSSLDAAIKQALNAGDNVVEVRTNATLAYGYSIGLASANIGSVGGSFTIRAGEGFTPVLDQRIHMYYGTADNMRSDLSTTVVLEGLTLKSTADGYPSLWAVGNVVVRNCTIDRVWGARTTVSTPYPYSLIMENCTINGETGTAVLCQYYKNVVLRDCRLRTDYETVANFQYECVQMIMKTGMPQAALDDKSLILDRCTLTVKDEGYHIRYPWSDDPHRGTGLPLVGTASTGHEPRLEAINCLFTREMSDSDRTEACWSLLGTKNKMISIFKHCTWRQDDAPTLRAAHQYQPVLVAVYIRDYINGTAGENLNQQYAFQNCLFDIPGQIERTGTNHSKTFAVLVENPTGDTTTGSDGNVYSWWGEDSVSGGGGNGYVTGPLPNITASNIQNRLTPFEATRLKYVYKYAGSAAAGQNITQSDGRLPGTDTLAIDQAVALTPPVTVDIDGDTRPSGSAADVGADEFVQPAEPNQARQWSIYQ